MRLLLSSVFSDLLHARTATKFVVYSNLSTHEQRLHRYVVLIYSNTTEPTNLAELSSLKVNRVYYMYHTLHAGRVPYRLQQRQDEG